MTERLRLSLSRRQARGFYLRGQLIGQDIVTIAENSSNLSGELLSPDFQEDAEAFYYDVDLRDEPAPSWVDYQRPLPPPLPETVKGLRMHFINAHKPRAKPKKP